MPALLFNRYSFIFFGIPLVLVIICSFSEGLRARAWDLKLFDWLALIGLYLTGIGVFYSYIAVLKVSEMSERYFIKLTFPEASKALSSVQVQLPKARDHTSTELLAETFFSRLPVLLKSVRSTPGHDLKSDILEAEAAYAKLKAWMHQERNLQLKVAHSPDYWVLVTAVGTVAEAMKNFMREEKAKP